MSPDDTGADTWDAGTVEQDGVGEPDRLGAQFMGTRNSFDYVGFLPSQIKTGLYRFRFYLDQRSGRNAAQTVERL